MRIKDEKFSTQKDSKIFAEKSAVVKSIYLDNEPNKY